MTTEESQKHPIVFDPKDSGIDLEFLVDVFDELGFSVVSKKEQNGCYDLSVQPRPECELNISEALTYIRNNAPSIGIYYKHNPTSGQMDS